MKTFISRLLLLAASLLCLNSGMPATGRDADKEKIETLRKALKREIAEQTEPETIPATFDEAIILILNLKPKKVKYDDRKNLTFEYAGKSFVLRDDGDGTERSHIRDKKSDRKAVLFVPEQGSTPRFETQNLQ